MSEEPKRQESFAAGGTGVVIYVKDLDRMRAFYETCFGMRRLEVEGKGLAVLDGPGMELSLVVVPEAVAATIELTTPPHPRDGTPIKLSFEVSSIPGVAQLVTEAGGWIEPGERHWRFREWRHVDCLDPEGNVLQLREPLETRLTGRDLTDHDLGGRDLNSVSFAGSNLTNARFAGADLSGACFDGANLTNADLTGAKLQDASFIDANLTHASLARAVARSANFAGANLTGCDLGSADLRDAELRLVGLNYSNVEDADLDGAELAGAIGVRISGEPRKLPGGWSLIDGDLVERES